MSRQTFICWKVSMIANAVNAPAETRRIESGVPISALAHSRLRETRWLFVGLWCYLLSQAFTVPILPIGPWPLWPNLSDVVFVVCCIVWFLQPKSSSGLNYRNSKVFFGLVAVLVFTTISYILVTVIISNITALQLWSNKGIPTGAYYLLRLVQFAVLFRFASSIPLDHRRVDALRRLSAIVLLAVCTLSIATYFSAVSTSTLGSWLPTSMQTAGPWAAYSMGFVDGTGVGAVGYNHGYTALQITMLLAITLQLRQKHLKLSDYFLVSIGCVGVFVSGSRSGLIGIVLFTVLFLLARPMRERLKAFFVIAVLAVAAFGFLSQPTTSQTESGILARQLTVLEFHNEDNLSGRTVIWRNIVAYLNEEPLRWVFGTGFGSAFELGDNAHMLALNIVLELGMVGLIFVSVLFYKILKVLNGSLQFNRSILWVTVALLLGSFSQETFYPVSAFGHFLGLYLVGIALSLNSPLEPGDRSSKSGMLRTRSATT